MSPEAQAKGDTAIFLGGLPGTERVLHINPGCNLDHFRELVGHVSGAAVLTATSWRGTRCGVRGQLLMLAMVWGQGSRFKRGCWEGRPFYAGLVRRVVWTSVGLLVCRASGARKELSTQSTCRKGGGHRVGPQ